ncbi:MAG: peptide deformylase [Clostridiales Family XIII bacterium]|jgi:peptide deformylase|nr:peptide deformylase [Clostridiales Family XIII bacterium]
MALRKIVLEGDEILKKKARDVAEINERILTLLDDMWETLEENNGVGLAAPQVGVLRRVAVIDTGKDEESDDVRIELINPRIVESDGEAEADEACLSIPGMVGAVTRPARVKAEALNRNGETFTIEGEGLLAKALCHEIDHLDGILFVDRASSVRSMDDDDEEEE